MRNHVTFTHSSFNTDWEAVDPDNPNCLGEEPTKLIVDGLRSQAGIQVRLEPLMEDWGWATLLKVQDRPFLLGVGAYEVEKNFAWLAFIRSELAFYRRWFGADDSDQENELCLAIQAVLATNSKVSNVRWYSGDDFPRGDEDDWTATPDG